MRRRVLPMVWLRTPRHNNNRSPQLGYLVLFNSNPGGFQSGATDGRVRAGNRGAGTSIIYPAHDPKSFTLFFLGGFQALSPFLTDPL